MDGTTGWLLLLPSSVAAKCTSVYTYPAELNKMQSIICSTAKAPVAELLGASDRNLEDPGLNTGWISMSSTLTSIHFGSNSTYKEHIIFWC